MNGVGARALQIEGLTPWVEASAPDVIFKSCVTLGKLLHVSVPLHLLCERYLPHWDVLVFWSGLP
jgi:hypothetical protein